MEMYYEQGLNRKDCELKIAEKYKRPFRIMSEKEIRIGGFLGLFSKSGVEVGFYFSPVTYKNPLMMDYLKSPPISWQASDFNDQRQQYTVEQYSRNTATTL